MNTIPSTSDAIGTLNVPGFRQAVLDTSALERLLREIEQHADVLEIVPKFPQRGCLAEGPANLAEARKLLLFHSVRGVQIRYRYDGAETCDTIMMAPEGFRLVRIHPELTPIA